MIRRPPRSTLDRSSAASDVYKRQAGDIIVGEPTQETPDGFLRLVTQKAVSAGQIVLTTEPVSYTHLRAHETVLDLVCRLLLEKTTKKNTKTTTLHNV